MNARTGSLPDDLNGSLTPEQMKVWWAERASKKPVMDLLDALKSASLQCGNVIYNCEQRPADNERHLRSWRLVKQYIDAALAYASDGETKA